MAQATDSTCMGWTANTAATAQGARHGESSQQTPQQQDVDHIQQHIDQVSAKRSETPSLCSSQNVVYVIGQ